MVSIVDVSMVVKRQANSRALSNKSSETDGWLKVVNVKFHEFTVVVFCEVFKPRYDSR